MNGNRSITAAQALDAIDQLVAFALRQQLIEPLDRHYCRNLLLDLFRFDAPANDLEIEEIPQDAPHSLLRVLLDYAEQNGLLGGEGTTARDLMDARIMGIVTPRPAETARRFAADTESSGVQAATEHFYQMCIDCNYIRMDRIRNNERWLHPSAYGDMEITINLSKPEKDPKEIAALRSLSTTKYPKCMLCEENVGFSGNLRHPARQNHRIIPLELDGKSWYFQYSPYLYYNEHSIVFNQRHVPMKLTDGTFSRLLAFVDKFPHYFIGSNADLPIVGGSILDHDHYQAGRHRFPLEAAPATAVYRHSHFADVRIATLKWPMSVIRLSSTEKSQLLQACSHLFKQWKTYSDPDAGIDAHSTFNGEAIPHNTVTPIVRINESQAYEIDLVLRNNRTDESHPEGIFHPHRELHHIKKENIGLIEVMGLAILPGRLKSETEQIADLMLEPDRWNAAQAEKAGHPLHLHAAWIEELLEQGEIFNSKEEAVSKLRHEIGRKFVEVLRHAGVFKDDDQGCTAFQRFMHSAGFEELS